MSVIYFDEAGRTKYLIANTIMHTESNTIDYCNLDQEPIMIPKMMVDDPATAKDAYEYE